MRSKILDQLAIDMLEHQRHRLDAADSPPLPARDVHADGAPMDAVRLCRAD
jgi:hypothetical protein